MANKEERLRIVKFKNWKDDKRAPCNITRGSAVVHGSLVYCSTTGSKAVFVYDSNSCAWSTLPECPQQFFALAVVNETLTAVGGFRGLSPTGALQSLIVDRSEVRDGYKWKELLPQMPTKRGRVAVLCAGKHLIAAGGQLAVVGGRLGPGVTSNSELGEGGYVNKVEMLDTESNQWYTLASLPEAMTEMSISHCGEYLYLLGGWSSKDRTKDVFTSHLQTLIRTANKSPKSSSVPAHSALNVWQRVADVPAYACTSAVLFNTVLVAVGGYDDSETPIDEVYSYEPLGNSWHVVGHLSAPRYQAVAATLPGERVFVVGGYDTEYKSTDHTEIGSV